MPALTTAIDVARPAPDVYSYATDPGRFSDWQKGVVAGSREKAGAPGVADRCITTRRIGFANRPITSEITHLDPPRTWGVRGTDGPIRAAVDVTVEPLTDAASRLTIAIEFAGHGVGRIHVPPHCSTAGSQGDASEPRRTEEAPRRWSHRDEPLAAGVIDPRRLAACASPSA